MAYWESEVMRRWVCRGGQHQRDTRSWEKEIGTSSCFLPSCQARAIGGNRLLQCRKAETDALSCPLALQSAAGWEGCAVRAARCPSVRAGQLRSPGWISECELACVETLCGIAVRIWNKAIVGAFFGVLLGKHFKNNHILQTDSFLSFFLLFFFFFLRPLINCPGQTVIFIIISVLCCFCDWALTNFSNHPWVNFQNIHPSICHIALQYMVASVPKALELFLLHENRLKEISLHSWIACMNFPLCEETLIN